MTVLAPSARTAAPLSTQSAAAAATHATSLSQSGLNLIKSFEGLRLTAYRDPGGVLTIGYGHTGSDVKPGEHITQARAEALLRSDTGWAQAAVRRDVKVPLTQGQFDALTSFTFNLGAGALGSSTLLKKLNAHDYAGAQKEFGKWVHAGGQVLPGLVRRRAAEAKLFGNKGPGGTVTPPKPKPPATHDYTVRSGDTMSGIADKFHLTLAHLAKLNPQVKNLNIISVGQKIHVTAAPKPSGGSSTGTTTGSTAITKGMPSTVGWSQEKEFKLYSSYLSKYGDAQAKADLASGKRVLLGLRRDTPMTANQPYRGAYDDRMVVLWKDSAGKPHVVELASNTEPNRRWAIPANESSKPVGRLTDMQTVHYHRAFNSKYGNHLEPSSTPWAQRDTNRDYRFENDEQSFHGTWGGQAMFIHRGGNGDTYSQGCQTMDPSHFDAFWSSLGTQRDFSYVLVNVNKT